MQDVLAILSGGVVGFVLGLLGGGGSILAMPLLLYVVGVRSVHMAIGTSALAVSVNAFANLIAHSRAGTVKWPCGLVFAVSGMLGATLGAALGRTMDGGKLLTLFAVVMLVVAAAMLRPRAAQGDTAVRIDSAIALRLVAIGLLVGFLSGFFGIGGGFLIVPGIMLGSGMATLNAVGTSLVSVGTFGLATAISYAAAGLVDWRVAGFFVAGGIAGGIAGTALAGRLAARRTLLTRIFAGVVALTGLFILVRSLAAS